MIIAGGAWAIAKRQIAPWRVGTPDPKDIIEHAPIIYTPNAARFVAKQGLDGGRSSFVEFVAHDPRIQSPAYSGAAVACVYEISGFRYLNRSPRRD
jgi:hypothetical protein